MGQQITPSCRTWIGLCSPAHFWHTKTVGTTNDSKRRRRNDEAITSGKDKGPDGYLINPPRVLDHSGSGESLLPNAA